MKHAVVLLIALLTCSAGPVFPQDHAHRRPDDIKQYLEHLDRNERDEYQKPVEVIEALQLKPGMAVADIGSGSGYFTRRLAEAVTGSGMVYAVDVEPEMLAFVKESFLRMPAPYSTQFILARPDDPSLPHEAVDLIFLCNTLHHLNERPDYFRRVRSSLKSGGRITIIDFHADERSGELNFPKRHLVPRETALADMTEAGYRLIREHHFLPRQYFLEFAPVPES